MSMQTALRRRLLDDPALAALVGARVDWIEAPQAGAWPRMTLLTVSETHDQDYAGFVGLREAMVQVDCWALDQAGARAVQAAALAALIPAALSEGVQFARAFVGRIRDLPEASETAPKFRVSMDIRVRWRAA
jgi:hypothetical protein